MRSPCRQPTRTLDDWLPWVNNLLKKVVKMTPHDHSVGQYFEGHKFELAGDFAKARKFYCLAVSMQPDNPIYIQAAARLALRMGNAADAKALLEEALACSRRNDNYLTATFTSLVCESAAI